MVRLGVSAMKTPPRLVFFGNERLVSGLPHTDAPILSGLIEHGYNIAAVIASHTEGLSRSSRQLEVAQIAQEHSIPLYLPRRPIEIIDELIDLKADAAVLSAYGRIIPQRVIDVFSPVGIINIHPSLLPRHRGPTPIETTILTGDETAGVSIMQLTAGMDEGPVYGSVTITLHGNETKFQLYERLASAGAQLLLDLLPDIIEGAILPKPQSDIGVSYTSLISKQDGFIDAPSETATQIERKIRGYLGYPKTRIRYKDTDVIITSAKVIDSIVSGELIVKCKDNSLLLIESLVAPNGKQMSGSAYLRGLR